MTTLSPDTYRRLRRALYELAVARDLPIPPGFSVDVGTPPLTPARDLIRAVQGAYGLPVTGLFDGPTRAFLLGAGSRPTVQVPLAFPPHGFGTKSLIVLHQTISPDLPGITDVKGVGDYLGHVGYGIHVIIDVEGNSAAVTPPYEKAIYYHASSTGSKGNGFVNTRGIGIEQVSYKTGDPRYWWNRLNQLHLCARWCAYLCRAHAIRPLYDPTCTNGIVGHNDVSVRYGVPGGHTDCQWPNYPTKTVAALARAYARMGT